MFEEIKSLLQKIVESLTRLERYHVDILTHLKSIDREAPVELLEKIRTDTDTIKQKVQF